MDLYMWQKRLYICSDIDKEHRPNHSPAVRGSVSMTSRRVLTPCSVFPSFLLLWLLALHMTIKTRISGGKKKHKGDSNRFYKTAIGLNIEQTETFSPVFWKDVNRVSNCALYQRLCSKLRYLSLNFIFPSNCLICDCVRTILPKWSFWATNMLTSDD